MKFNQKEAKKLGTTLGSAVVGVKVSKGATSVIPAKMKNPATHGLVTILSVVAASMITGNSFGAQVGRGIAIGIGIDQGNMAINSVVAPVLPEADTKRKKLINAAFDVPETAALQGYQGLNSYSPEVFNSFKEETTGVTINLGE